MTPTELRERRRALGMSQAKLAAALGITETRYQGWETGRNGIPPFLHLALDALEMRVGSNPYRRKLTDREAQAILDARGKERGADLARKYQVSRAAVSLIHAGKIWTHLRPRAEDDRGNTEPSPFMRPPRLPLIEED
jgi:DNA-binding XRE family transcriptional regulator